MKSFFTFLLCSFSLCAMAQKKGEVTVIKDPLVDTMIERRIMLSKKPATATGSGAGSTGATPRRNGGIISQMGYRVQVFYGPDRRETFSEQAKFKTLYPKLNTYITYKEPNYYLRVGDFRTRLEAQRLMNELRGDFPTLFIFREKINAPSLD